MAKNKKKYSDYETRQLGKLTKRIREAEGLTQIDLAIKTNISIAVINKLENGRYPYKISMRSIQKIARVLNTSVGYLLGETKNKKRKNVVPNDYADED